VCCNFFVINFYQQVDQWSCTWASAGGRNGHLLPLEIGTKKENFLENVKSVVGLILAMTVYLPI